MTEDVVINNSSEDESDYVLNELVKYNAKKVPITGAGSREKLDYVAKFSNGKIIGGINSVLYSGGILRIDILWIDDAYRMKGIGSRLIKKVEEIAKQKGCGLIHLDSFDWQAKDFYLKHGYEVFGILDDCPPGHKRYYMKKIL